MKKGSGKKPECHPNRKHYAKGLCAACYMTQLKKRKKKPSYAKATEDKQHKEPVVVTHTHDVIRQVQQEKKQTMANAEPKRSPQVPPGDEAGYPPPEYIENLPEGSVISPLGVTRPPEEILMDPYRKERSKDKQLAGKVLLKGKTHHGFTYERIVDVLQPRTEKGMFQWFKAHFPDAVDEDFSAKAVSDEEAEKLQKEWTKEQLGKQRDEREKRAKESEASAKEQAKAEKATEKHG